MKKPERPSSDLREREPTFLRGEAMTRAPSRKGRRLHLREVAAGRDASDYEGIGSDLRAARSRQKLTIEDVARDLRISHHYLESSNSSPPRIRASW